MNYTAIFSGAGGVVIGAVIGAWFTAQFTYRFQQKLLDQQLKAQRAIHEELLASQKESHSEVLKHFAEVRTHYSQVAVKASEISHSVGCAIDSFNSQMNQMKGFFCDIRDNLNRSNAK